MPGVTSGCVTVCADLCVSTALVFTPLCVFTASVCTYTDLSLLRPGSEGGQP